MKTLRFTQIISGCQFEGSLKLRIISFFIVCQIIIKSHFVSSIHNFISFITIQFHLFLSLPLCRPSRRRIGRFSPRWPRSIGRSTGRARRRRRPPRWSWAAAGGIPPGAQTGSRGSVQRCTGLVRREKKTVFHSFLAQQLLCVLPILKNPLQRVF